MFLMLGIVKKKSDYFICISGFKSICVLEVFLEDLDTQLSRKTPSLALKQSG